MKKTKKAPKQVPPRVSTVASAPPKSAARKVTFSSTIFNLRGDFVLSNLSNQLTWGGFTLGDDVTVIVEKVIK